MQNRLSPLPFDRRRQLVDCPGIVEATQGGRAIKVAGGIKDQAADGTISGFTEGVQYPLLPASSGLKNQLKNRSAAAIAVVGTTAGGRCAVEITGGIEDQSGGDYIPSVVEEVEAMQHLLLLCSRARGRP